MLYVRLVLRRFSTRGASCTESKMKAEYASSVRTSVLGWTHGTVPTSINNGPSAKAIRNGTKVLAARPIGRKHQLLSICARARFSCYRAAGGGSGHLLAAGDDTAYMGLGAGGCF